MSFADMAVRERLRTDVRALLGFSMFGEKV
jgi:hypothetical protein